MGSFLLNPFLYSSLIEAFGGDNVFYTEDSESGYFTHLFTSTGGSNFIIEKGSDILEYIAVGGGGGGGGKDSTTNGGSGGSGAGIYGKFLATFNKTIAAYVASGGIQGTSSAATAAGGAGGIGYAAGGKGGNAGSTGTSGGGHQPRGAITTEAGAVGFNYSGDGGGGGGGGAGYTYGGLGQASGVAQGASGGQNYNNTGVIIESTTYNGTNGASNSTATTAAVSISESSIFGFTNTYGTGGATTAAGGSGIVGLKYKTNKLGIVTSGLQLYLDANIKQSFTLLPKFRYIRWTTYGNTVNASNHFCELQVLSNTGVNRASGIVATVVSGTVVSGTGSIITDGNLATTSYWDFNSASATVQVDLGSIYDDIQNVRFWNYYGDTRSYYNVTISISEDGSNFYNIYGPKTTQTVAAGISVNDVWRDLSGSGFNATLINSPTYSLNESLVFNGTNQTVSVLKPYPNIDGLFSAEIWFKVNSYTTNFNPFHKGSHYCLQIYANSYSWADSSNYSYANFGTRTVTGIGSTGVWKQIVITKDSSYNVRLYLNGSLADTRTAFTGPIKAVTSTLWLNGYSDTDSIPTASLYNGELGIFRVYNKTLSDSEILQNFNVEKSKYGL